MQAEDSKHILSHEARLRRIQQKRLSFNQKLSIIRRIYKFYFVGNCQKSSELVNFHLCMVTLLHILYNNCHNKWAKFEFNLTRITSHVMMKTFVLCIVHNHMSSSLVSCCRINVFSLFFLLTMATYFRFGCLNQYSCLTLKTRFQMIYYVLSWTSSSW